MLFLYLYFIIQKITYILLCSWFKLSGFLIPISLLLFLIWLDQWSFKLKRQISITKWECMTNTRPVIAGSSVWTVHSKNGELGSKIFIPKVPTDVCIILCSISWMWWGLWGGFCKCKRLVLSTGGTNLSLVWKIEQPCPSSLIWMVFRISRLPGRGQ